MGSNPIQTTKRHGGEMADTRDLKSLAVKSVPVRVRPVVPNLK